MSRENEYRLLNSIEIRPVVYSLGLTPTDFIQNNNSRKGALFNAVLNGPKEKPDSLWVFIGSDYLEYNLRTDRFVHDKKEIAGNWGGPAWPPLFSSGIDAAVWGGPAYPHLWYFFKDELFVRLNSGAGDSWPVDSAPMSLLAGGWGSVRGTAFEQGFDAALHGIGAKYNAQIHLFKNDEYICHDLNTGTASKPVSKISSTWNLPTPFCDKIDLAFYGTGSEEEDIFFISGSQFAQYDTKRGEVLKIGAIDSRFKSFSEFMARPQLFLVENYSLENYAGPTQIGRLVDAKSLVPGMKSKTLMVTETVSVQRSSVTQSILQSQDSSVVDNFNEQLNQTTQSEEGSEGYKYNLSADAHGEASANSVWGGEVSASLDASGGSDSLRSKFAESAFSAISKQVTESTRQISQRTYSSESSIENKERVLNQQELEISNDTDRLRVFEFYQQMQNFVALLVLKNIKLGYTDGLTGLKIVPLSSAKKIINDVLAREETKTRIINYIKNELSNITDWNDTSKSLLAEASEVNGGIQLLRDQSPTYSVKIPNGENQIIQTEGYVIKAVKKWTIPTYSMIAREKLN